MIKQVEQIKDDIKLQIHNLEIAEKEGFITEFGKGQLECLEGLLSFIESLQEEPVSEDLEEAAKSHSKESFNGMLIEDNMEAFKAGANWQKQQMMKDAMEGKVVVDSENDWQCIRIFKRVNKIGDKVKLIIIKED